MTVIDRLLGHNQKFVQLLEERSGERTISLTEVRKWLRS